MAQRVQTLLIDDLDGGDAEGTVRFGLDGAEYEIDLNATHAGALRKALAPYVKAARRAPGSAVRRPDRSGRRAARAMGPTRRRSASGLSRKASRSRTAGACPPSWS